MFYRCGILLSVEGQMVLCGGVGVIVVNQLAVYFIFLIYFKSNNSIDIISHRKFKIAI